MIEMILIAIIIIPKIPRGCEWKEEAKSPLNRYEIELPNPHPGQNSKPKLERGQIVKWLISGVWIIAR